jgi:hypothetical protein
MNTKFIRSALIAAGLAFAALVPAQAAEASKEVTAMANKVITSLEKGDYEAFVADADAAWKRNAPQAAFNNISNMMKPKMQGGYEASYIGELKGPAGSTQTLWKLTMKSPAEDILVAIYIKDGKVTRFALPK